MPEFKIRMPDGQIKTVSGPDREGAMAFAKANYRPTTAPATTDPEPEVNPEGVSIGRAFKRGAIETYAGLPTALAVADIQKFQDASQLQQPGGVNALAYDELMKTRVPLEAMAGRSVNLDVNTLEGRRSVDALQDRYNLKPGEKVDYLQTLDKRIENATNLRSNPQDEIDAQWERIKTNAQYAGYLQDKAAAIPRGVRGGIYAEELANAPDTWKGWLSTVTNDPVGFVEFIGETAAESGAQIAAGLTTSLLTRSPKAGALVMGSGGFAREYGNEVASFLEENGIDLSDPTAAKKMFNDPQLMDEANSRGVTRGVVIAAADFAGQGLVAREFFKKSLARQVGVQMGTEGAGEAAATQAVGDDFSVKDTATEALAGGASAAPEALVAGNSLWQKRYNKEDGNYKAAASDLARLLRSISDNEGYNLKDVTTQGAAKQTLEAAHEKISDQIKAIVGADGVRERLSPKNAETLDQLLEDYATAQTAVRQGKNKVKSKVTDENAQAIARLLGPSKEAGQLLNLFAQGNVLTDLFADGTKGGVSQFTDYLNPLQNDGNSGLNIHRGLNVIGAGVGATQFGIPATAGIVLGGRALDAVTGRRSKVNRFVKKLEKLTGQKAPEGPSLIAAAALEKQQAEQAKADDAAAKEVQAQVKAAQEAENANITGTLAGMTGNATDGSPLGTIAVGTGIPTEEIQTVVSELRLKHPADSKNPQDVAVNKVLDDAQAGLNGEQRPIRALTQLVNLVNNHLDASLMDGGSSVQRTSLPDGDLARAKAIQMGNAPKMDAAPAAQASPAPNVDTTAPAQPTVNGNQTTTSENYQAGIDANRTEGLRLQAQLLDTPNLPDSELEALYTALEAVQTENMPLAAMEDVAQLLVDEGVARENVDKFYKPYVDRVRRQQKRKPSMLKQAQATQEAIQGEPGVNTQTAPAPSVLEKAQGTGNPGQPISDANLEVNSRVLESVLDDYGVKGKITNASSDPAVTVYELDLAPGLKASRVIGLSDAIARSMSAPSAQVSTVPGQSAIRIEIPNQPISDDARGIPPGPFRPEKVGSLYSELKPDQVPTQTRKAYKLMKVQSSRNGVVMPLFAKPDGQTQGFLANRWYKAEDQQPTIGAKPLARRPGIHAVNLPVFDQGKANVKGSQRVWVEVEIPETTPETQAESDASLNSQGKLDGIQGRLINPNESYDYKTNPSATNDAGGWPVAGSMKVLRILADGEVSEILNANGLSHQVENSTTQIDQAAADVLNTNMGLANIADTPGTRPQSNDSRSIPEGPPRQFGEKTDVSLETSLSNAFQAAQAKIYAKGRDFKLDLQAQSLAAQEREGIDLNTLDEANIDRLADFVVEDALEALKDNENAIGWYGRTVTQALETVGELHPEVLTDPKSKMQFIWATAVTSNGLKVDKNFELALDVYETLKETGRFPTDAGIGQAAAAINSGLAQYHTMLEKFQRKSNSDEGAHNLLIEFMNSKVPVKELEKEYGVKISGEGKNTLVRGASILGPKIGNGFYSNLYGNFDELTMDRWLMRTVGRWRGGLVKLNKPMIAQKTKEIQNMMPDLEIKAFKPLFSRSDIQPAKGMSKQKTELLSAEIAKLSMDPAWRSAINAIPGGESLRKAGNGLAKYLDGQVEAPAGAKERTFIREVFQRGLKRLQDAPSVRQRSNDPLTMSDLQALLWYPEKRLYDTAKQKDGESRGYEDDEAPDYANAARKAVGDRLGSAGAAGPGGGGTIDPNAGPGADNSIISNLLNPPGNTSGRASGAGTGRPTKGPSLARVALTAVKRFVPQSKAAFQVGKRGTPYENGVQTLDQAVDLAHTLGITVRLFDSQEEMYASRSAFDPSADPSAVASFYQRGAYADGKGAEGTVFGLNPGSMLDSGGSVSGIDALSSLIHEIAHGMTLSPLDLNGSQVTDTEFTNPVTGQPDRAPMGSFAGSALRPLLEGKGDPDIMSEIDNLQMNVDAHTTNDPGQRSALREVRKLSTNLKDWKAYYDREVDNGFMSRSDADTGMANRQDVADGYTDYMQSVRELAVDPVLIYLINPKLAKSVMPKTAALIREQFNNAGNKKVKFFSHPAAVVIATVMAMLAQGMAEEEEEKQRMQMPPGALTPPPPSMGALTA